MPPPTPQLPPPPNSTSTGNAADSVEGGAEFKPNIDFVDTTIYCGIALTCDLMGLIPGVAYVTSPASILGFKTFFWLKGVSPPGSNAALVGGAVTEMVPVVSEILPGCFGFVLLTCAGEMLNHRRARTASAGGAVGGVATNEAVMRAKSNKPTVDEQNEAVMRAKSNKPTVDEQNEAVMRAKSEGGSTSTSDSGSSFSGQVDFSSFGQAVGTREEGRVPSGLPQAGPAGGGGPGTPGTVTDDGTGGRFAGGSPTSPGGAPTDPQAEARARSNRARMRRLQGGAARVIKPTRIYSMEDARKAKELRDEQDRLAREKMAA